MRNFRKWPSQSMASMQQVPCLANREVSAKTLQIFRPSLPAECATAISGPTERPGMSFDLTDRQTHTTITVTLAAHARRRLITKVFVVNPCDSCNTDVDTPLNVIHVHVTQYYCVYRDCYGLSSLKPCIKFFITFTFSLLLTGFLLT